MAAVVEALTTPSNASALLATPFNIELNVVVPKRKETRLADAAYSLAVIYAANIDSSRHPEIRSSLLW